MAVDEIESVLANWIEQAHSSIGQLPPDVSRSAWVAARFAEWWREQAGDRIADAERAASSVRKELLRLGGWELFGEALHELIHLQEAVGDLRGLMRLPDEAL